MNFLWNLIFVTLSVLLSVSVNQCFAEESRIIGGTIVTNNDAVRHQVSIRVLAADFVFGNGHICGGMLISTDTVLTAAHCMFDDTIGKLRAASEFRIAAGTLVRNGSPTTLFMSLTSSIKIHENYNSETFENDVAVMKLSTPIPENNAAIYPVNLRTVPVKVGTTCQVTGWGLTTLSNNVLPNDLRTATITVYGLSLCNATVSYDGFLRPGMLCIGNMAGGIDSCSGDSGGPVICDNLLTGIVSFGNQCAYANYPGIYTDVEYQKSWIFANHGNNLKINFLVLTVFCIFAIFYFK